MTVGAEDLDRYLRILAGADPSGRLLEIRSAIPGGMRQIFTPATRPELAARTITRLAARTNVYVGVLLRRRRGGGRDACERAHLAFIEIDRPDAAQRLAQFRCPPSIVVASGGSPGHAHAYWQLQHPIGIDELETANRRLALHLGGDLASVDAARILRPPTSLIRKSRDQRRCFACSFSCGRVRDRSSSPAMSGDGEARWQAASGYVHALFCGAPEGSLVELRFRVASGMAQRFAPASRPRDVVDAVRSLAVRTEVFVGVLPRSRPGGRVADVVEKASVLWADCDTRTSVAALARFAPTASMVVASGNDRHLHAYWFLREPVGLDQLESLNRRVAALLGADGGVVTKPHTILRPAGSVNRKRSPPTPVRLLSVEQRHRVSAEEVEAQLPLEPAEVTPISRSESSGVSSMSPWSDPLRLVPPPVYFERLTGLRVGPSGKLRCLFHDDRSPSLHVYREPGRGWYCFGCGRGGSIYDLAALLSGRETRGQDFAELRRELEELMLPLRQVSHSERSWTPQFPS
jgi:hypothetical protein